MSSSGTVISGCGGDFTGPDGFNAKFKEWTATLEVGTEDTSGFDDGPFKNNTPVSISISGTAMGFLTTTTPTPIMATDCTVLDDFVGSFVLTADSGKTYSFQGIMTRAAMTRAAQKAGTTTYNFVSNGTITNAWA